MSAAKMTLGAFVASFFGQSDKVISEKLTTDEHNQFTSEAGELQNKIDGLQTQVTSLEGEKTTLQESVTTLTSERDAAVSAKTTLEGEKTTLQESVTNLTTDRDKYKAWFDKQKGAGNALPEGDATSQPDTEMTNYNAHALEVFRKAQGK